MDSGDVNERKFFNSSICVSYPLRTRTFDGLINLKHLSLYPINGASHNSFCKLHSILLSGLSHTLFPQLVFDLDFVESLLNKAYESSAMFYDINDAVIAAEGFVWPLDAEVRDIRDLHDLHGGDIIRLIRARQLDRPATRMSVERLLRLWDRSDPDFEALMEMAGDGVTVIRDRTFVPTLFPSPFGPKYTLAHSAVNQLLYDSYGDKLGLVLPTSLLCEADPELVQVNFSRLGWAPKSGSVRGRVTCDYGHSPLGHGVGTLNCPATVESARDKYGSIQLATVEQDLVPMILEQIERVKLMGYGEKDLVLWGMDLKGAFTLAFFRPRDCCLLALPMTQDLSFVPIAGNFGSSQFPFFFNVISRAILRRATKELKGGVRIYVDDLQGCCLLLELIEDLAHMRIIIEDLLGDDSIAHKKTVSGRRLDWIGWSFDLDTMCVGISDRNFYKTLFGFLSVEKDGYVQVSLLHKLASWASRYVAICPFLSPFSGYLYDAFSGYRQEVYIPLPKEAYLVILMWRLFLLLMKLEPQGFTRSFRTYGNRPPSVALVEYDGCPRGVGFILHQRCPSSGNWAPFYAVSLFDGFTLGNDPAYQNAMEFISIVMGLLTLVSLGFQGCVVDILGDNTTSLHWSTTLKFRSGTSSAAALCFVLLGHYKGIEVGNGDFRTGASNVNADRLSRGESPSVLGFDSASSYELCTMPPTLGRLHDLLDPSALLVDESQLWDVWREMSELLSKL